MGTKNNPVITLCGSTRFYDAFQRANYELTMLGAIVLSVGFYPHSSELAGHGEGVGHDSAEKVALDELHKRKIDMSDEIFVLNVNGYIGTSTQSEIWYAVAKGKPVKYLENPQRTLRDSVRDAMDNPYIKLQYPHGVSAMELAAFITPEFPLCSVIDVANTLQEIYG